MPQQEAEDVLYHCVVHYHMDTFDYKGLPDQARTQGDKKEMKREDKVLIGACAFLALYGGFLYWGQTKPPARPTFPYPNLFVGPVLKTIRPDPSLSAHPDGSVFWRIK